RVRLCIHFISPWPKSEALRLGRRLSWRDTSRADHHIEELWVRAPPALRGGSLNGKAPLHLEDSRRSSYRRTPHTTGNAGSIPARSILRRATLHVGRQA